eukprot:5608387-Amphidinium_carterae.2
MPSALKEGKSENSFKGATRPGLGLLDWMLSSEKDSSHLLTAAPARVLVAKVWCHARDNQGYEEYVEHRADGIGEVQHYPHMRSTQTPRP